jgi:uncharacterized repeat protein (TIGR01451 family)
MFAKYVWADLVRNPRRTLSTMIGVILGVGLACAILFFVDGLSSSMTEQAVSPLAIDMQLVQTNSVSGDLRLGLDVTPAGKAATGDVIQVRLTVQNHGNTPANEVVVRSVPASGLAYRTGSAVANDQMVPDEGESPLARGVARMGLNIGTVEPGATVEIHYEATVSEARDISVAAFSSTISSREAIMPVAANTGKQPGLAELASRIRSVDGVSSAEQLSFVDLPPGSLSAAVPVSGQVRLFGFDPGYAAQDATIAIVAGKQVPGEALVSAEAARALSVGLHDAISVKLPDGTQLERRISGIVDLTRARSLFLSRVGLNLELFFYVPASVIVDAGVRAGEHRPGRPAQDAARARS